MQYRALTPFVQITYSALIALWVPLPAVAYTPAPVQAQQNATQTLDLNIGTLNPFDPKPIEKMFTLKNHTNAPLVLERMTTSCGCAAALLYGNQSLPYTLGKGKTLSLYATGQSDPAFVLQVKGTLPPVIEYEPLGLTFGRVPSGTAKELPLTLYLSDELEKLWGSATLTSPN